MKRMSICIAAIVGALAIGAMAGCSSQPASSASGSAESASAASATSVEAASAASAASVEAASSEAASDSASASAEAAQSQAEIIAELKDAIAKVPAYKSVTITMESESTFTGDAEATDEAGDASDEAASSESAASSDASAAADEASTEPETLTETTVYKFDASGDKLKTSADIDAAGIKMQYYTEGEDAVCVTDGPVYSGTIEQFDLAHAKGVDAFIVDTIGDLNTLADCTATAEKMEAEGLTFYMLTLDPEKYTAADEALAILAEYGTPLKEAFLTIGFEEDGSITSIDLATNYESSKSGKHLMFSDYDSTVIDPMPEADKTYEEMDADMQAKMDALLDDAESGEAAEVGSC